MIVCNPESSTNHDQEAHPEEDEDTEIVMVGRRMLERNNEMT